MQISFAKQKQLNVIIFFFYNFTTHAEILYKKLCKLTLYINIALTYLLYMMKKKKL